jgi:hypothetical protein
MLIANDAPANAEHHGPVTPNQQLKGGFIATGLKAAQQLRVADGRGVADPAIGTYLMKNRRERMQRPASSSTVVCASVV